MPGSPWPAPPPLRPPIDPLIAEMFNKLPEPGDAWPTPERQLWFDTLTNIFAMVYKESTP